MLGVVPLLLICLIALRIVLDKPIVPQDARVGKGSMIYRTTHYTLCSHKTTTTSLAGEELYGLDAAGVAAQFPAWRLDELKTLRIELSRSMRQYCGRHYILGNSAGRVAIFQNVEGGETLSEVRVLDIWVDTLPQAVREELMAGQVYASLTDIERAIEDYTS